MLPRHSLALTVKSRLVHCDPFLHRAMKQFHPFILDWPELIRAELTAWTMAVWNQSINQSFNQSR